MFLRDFCKEKKKRKTARMRTEKASPGGKLAPEATEGELRAKRHGYPFGYNRSSLNFRIPLQPLRGSVSLRLGHTRVLTCHRHVIHYARAASLPPGDAFLARTRIAWVSTMSFT
jgi:hypothetical protein